MGVGGASLVQCAGLVLTRIPGEKCSSFELEHLLSCCSKLLFCTRFEFK